MAAGYRVLGLNRGDLIGNWTQNSAEWYLNMFAAARAGMTMVNYKIYVYCYKRNNFYQQVGLNPAYQAPEILFCLKKIGAKAIFVNHKSRHQNYYDILRSIIPALDCSNDRVINSNQLENLKTIIVNSSEKLR